MRTDTLRYPRGVAPAYSNLPRYVLYTVAISVVIAAAITAFGSHSHGFGANLVYSLCIGLLTWATIDFPRRLLWPWGAPSVPLMIAIVFAAAPVGWFGGSFIASGMLGDPWRPAALGLNAVLGYLALTAGAGLGGTFFFWTRERLADVERGAAEARLKLLQAQIEPHFLFNTLANLQALIAVDPQRAQAMLAHLDSYLRATLASTRSEKSTLAEEFALLSGYLEIIAIRMGTRLSYEIDLPDSLAGATLPPMLLQPLVENSVRHGLEPTVEGGRVRVSAIEDDGKLVLTVEDNGLGPGAISSSAGTGIGLAHVKERIAAVYGPAASFQAAPNPGGGMRVELRLPLEMSTQSIALSP